MPTRRFQFYATTYAAASIALVILGCMRDKGRPGGASSATPIGSGGPASPTSNYPIVSIPPGVLIAGSPCQSIPRITTEELEGPEIHMGAFDIDAYPYPDDPAQAPATGVSRDEAQTLCAARGRRLCTELEWERACKGPSNGMYEYGRSFNPAFCTGGGAMLRPAGTYEKCQSVFGVKAMHGAVWEWTSSEWGRGAPGGLAAVRGGFGPHLDLQTRCANGQSRSPTEKAADIGFRCCGGAPNAATVNLTLRQLPPIVAEGSVDPALSSRLLQGLPQNMREIPGVPVTIDKIWRWHPRANEELLLVRYVGRPSAPPSVPFYVPIVFHLCGASNVLARLRGPVEKMEEPGTGATAEELSVAVQTGTDRGDARFVYHYGAVNMTQPTWVKAGTTLSAPADAGAASSTPPSPPPRLKPPKIR